jgi:hypothetical protein
MNPHRLIFPKDQTDDVRSGFSNIIHQKLVMASMMHTLLYGLVLSQKSNASDIFFSNKHDECKHQKLLSVSI